MAIPEEQLRTWSNQGGTVASVASHTAIRNAILADDSPIKEKKPEIFLQGSYKNSTNIRADSDVDVVIQLNSVWYRDLSALPADQLRAYEQSFGPGRYTASDWRRDVEATLRKKFGAALQPGGGKAFHVVTGPGNMTADVLPAIQFKKYRSFFSPANETFDEGVEFADSAGNRIINFPKLHIRNGEAKNSTERTNGWYKPTIRMFKNARNCPGATIPDGCAPSYFVECLLYNVPDQNFGTNFQNTFYRVIRYLLENPISNFRCQNEQLDLFGTSPVQWNMTDASTFVHELARLWDNW